MDAEELLWAPPSGSRRGVKPTLSREQIVRAAVELADADGLGALSMQRVARSLDAATMSLYRHVPGKDELISLMFEAAIGRPPDLGAGPWRDRMAAWARANRDVFAKHLWTLPLATGPRTMGPRETAWIEAALGVLATTGLPPAAMLEVLLLVNGYVRGAAVGHDGGPVVPGQQTLLRFGRLAEFPVFASVLAEAGEQEDQFEFGLARVLDGVALFIGRSGGQ